MIDNNRQTDRNRRNDRNRSREPKDNFEEKILLIRRVSKKTTGGNYISFSALAAVGDHQGKVGVGLARGLEVPTAIKKAIRLARKSLITVPLYNETIPHEVNVKYKSSLILLKPAPLGVGLKLGSVVRVILGLAGVKNASGKIIRSNNQISNAYATIEALKLLKVKS